MASPDERPGGPPRLPPRPAIALRERDREKLDLPASVRCLAPVVSRGARLPRLQDRESAGSTKAVTCAVLALLPPSDFLPRRPLRNSEDAVIPFPTPMLVRHRCQLNKVWSNRANFTIQRSDLSYPWEAQLLEALKSCLNCMESRSRR